VLGQQGYKVIEARHGLEALGLLEANAPLINLVLTDVVMPEMGGSSWPAGSTRCSLACPDVHVRLHRVRQAPAGHLRIRDSFLQKPFPRKPRH
jgi:DNA-binding response OmpR family regulator